MVSDRGEKTSIQSRIDSIASEMYATLAEAFPICCASDEFIFFPQATRMEPDWSVWDDLSPDRVEDVCRRLSGWESGLEGLARSLRREDGDMDTLIDAEILVRMSRTLREQLREVKSQRNQPTFALTVVTAGLIQALEAGENAFRKRIAGLSAFVDRCGLYLEDVPELFLRMGIEMTEAIIKWLRTLRGLEGVETACHALEGFSEGLHSAPTVEDFRLPQDLLERLLSDHFGSGLSLSQILDELSHERAFMRAMVQEEAFRVGHCQSWRDAWMMVPHDRVPEGGKLELLGQEIQSLRRHCLEQGFVNSHIARQSTLEVAVLPESLSAVRAADSYNARPGHPYPGGTFYIFAGGSLGAAVNQIHPVYRMTVAHEAWPGHHLLDLSRWSQARALRRPLEYPLFYEGWACFAEELVRDTGYFNRPYDRLLLARRRYRHAVRGAVDLLLHQGRLDPVRAARVLTAEGFPPERAKMTVEKYALRPGYQMCYTLGSRTFRRLFDRYGVSETATFVRRILASGEIGFDHLEEILKKGEDRTTGITEATEKNQD